MKLLIASHGTKRNEFAERSDTTTAKTFHRANFRIRVECGVQWEKSVGENVGRIWSIKVKFASEFLRICRIRQ